MISWPHKLNVASVTRLVLGVAIVVGLSPLIALYALYVFLALPPTCAKPPRQTIARPDEA